MIIILHVLTALTSLIYSSITMTMPSRAKLRTAYGLTAATIATGTYLTIMNPTKLLEICSMGLIYTAATSLVLVSARKKLANELD